MKHSSIAEDLLRFHGYRSTPQRHLILKALEQEQEHVTIEQILERVHVFSPHITLSTVYRTLELLQTLGCVQMLHLPGQPAQYEKVTSQVHAHVVCRRCQMLLHLEESSLGPVLQTVVVPSQFHEISLDLLVQGYCDACWQTLQSQ